MVLLAVSSRICHATQDILMRILSNIYEESSDPHAT